MGIFGKEFNNLYDTGEVSDLCGESLSIRTWIIRFLPMRRKFVSIGKRHLIEQFVRLE